MNKHISKKGTWERVIYAIVLGLCATNSVYGQDETSNESIVSFAEYGMSVHGGDNTPLWQVSNRHGFSSLNNNTYLRGGVFYQNTYKNWTYGGGIDMAVTAGFTSTFVLQQAYAEARYKKIGMFVGSREINSPLLNQELSSGGLTWSGNARPIPQIWIGLSDYISILPRLALKADFSYGWFTDNKYQAKQVGENFWYTKNIKYHHKSGFLRIGLPQGHWQVELGMSMDVQFGGNKKGGEESGDLGNSWKDYLRVIIPLHGSDQHASGERVAYQGNFMGSEHIKLTYNQMDFSVSAYLENYYDDMSGMGKLNGWDGLWGIELKLYRQQIIEGFVLEYYQTTNQSGPMHGLDDSIVKKTGGADDYYNNYLYPGWVHWGMTMANPLIASPIYNKDGDMTFKYNRVKAIHVGCSGSIARDWRYVFKMSYNQTWGTPFKPTAVILENFSTFASFYYTPRWCKGWKLVSSIAHDMGDIYGNNIGYELKINKTF